MFKPLHAETTLPAYRQIYQRVVTLITTALSVGYDNVSAFIALFQQRLGVTPGRYFSGQSDRVK